MYPGYSPPYAPHMPDVYDVGAEAYLSPYEVAAEEAAIQELQAMAAQGYDITPEVVGEVGRRRGLRRFGRIFGAIATGGMSEMARAGVRRRAGRIARQRAPVQPIPAPAPAMVVAPAGAAAQHAAAVAQNVASQTVANAMTPKLDTSGLFGLSDVTLPPGDSGTMEARSEFSTLIRRFVFQAFDPNGDIPPDQAEAYIRITSIHVAGQSIFSTNQGAPLRTFANATTGAQLRTRMVGSGQSVAVTVKNLHNALTINVGGSGLGPQEA